MRITIFINLEGLFRTIDLAAALLFVGACFDSFLFRSKAFQIVHKLTINIAYGVLYRLFILAVPKNSQQSLGPILTSSL